MNLSIIIVNFNTKNLLKQCLESIRGDGCLVLGDSEKINKKTTITKPPLPNTEIIVVDNGSTDGSVQEIKDQSASWRTKIKNTNQILKIIENDENLGFAKAVNQGIKESCGKAVFLLNSDTIVKQGTLGKLIEFEQEVRPAIIGAKMLNPDGTVQGSCFNLPTIRRAILEFWLRKKNYFSKYAPPGDDPVEVEAVSGGAMLISRDVIDRVGLFDERYFMYFEDLDYCRRAKKAGIRIYYLPSAEVVHEHGASGKNLADSNDQWKRLIPSSKIYYGSLKHYAITLIIKVGQKCQSLLNETKN